MYLMKKQCQSGQTAMMKMERVDAEKSFIKLFQCRTTKEQKWALPHWSGPGLKFLSGMQSACRLQASIALFDIQTNTCQKSMSHLTQLLEIGEKKKLNLFLALK